MVEFLYSVMVFFVEIAPYMVLGLLFVGLLHVFVSKDLIAKQLGKPSLFSSVKAAVLGVPLPLCSCGVVPTAVHFAKSGASKGAVVSFLISTPQTGVDSIIATYGMLGPVFAVFRPLAAFISGIIGGTIASFVENGESLALSANDEPKDDESCCKNGSCSLSEPKKQNIFVRIYNYAFVEFLDDIAFQFIIGVLIAGVISYIIPEDFFLKSGLGSGPLGILLMIVIGVPMYVCATASIPIAVALMLKGVSPGAVFVFLAVGPMTNAASLTVLYKVLKTKLLVVYVFSGAVAAVIFGLLLDFFMYKTDVSLSFLQHQHIHSREGASKLFMVAISIVFAAMLFMSVYRKVKERFFIQGGEEDMSNSTTVKIEGMSCNHCSATVSKTLGALTGVESVEVNLARGEAVVAGSVSIDVIKAAIEDVGYKVV